MAYSQAASNLFIQLNTQYDIVDILAPMDGLMLLVGLLAMYLHATAATRARSVSAWNVVQA